jgi:signal transduction histidine kinase
MKGNLPFRLMATSNVHASDSSGDGARPAGGLPDETRPPRSWWTLERKLPLAVSGLLAAFVISALALSFDAVRETMRAAASERLDAVARDLADYLSQSVETGLAPLQRAADDPRVVIALSDSTAAAREAAAEALADAGPGRFPWHLRDARGALIAGPDSVPPDAAASFAGAAENPGYSRFTVSNNRGAFWITVPIRRDGRTIGHVAQFRIVQSGQGLVQRLIGSGATLSFSNRGGDVWIGLDGEPMERPATSELPADTTSFATASDAAVLARIEQIPGTPWLIGVSMQLEAVDRPARAFLRRAAAVGLVLILLGAAVAWFLSRRVTKPVLELRAAAAGIAGGDYDRRVDIDRADELGDLSVMFNLMAERIQTSHSELGLRYDEAQSLAVELEMSNEELERAMTDADLSRAEAQAANRAKSEFLATMSHEIRTPINAIIGYADLLDAGIPDPPTSSQRSHIDRIRASGSHLGTLIDDVLDIARIESGHVRLDRVVAFAGDAIEGAVAALQPAAHRKSVTLSAHCPPDGWYRGDPKRVQQIVLNLLSNAVKFTPPRGSIEVECVAHAEPLPEIRDRYNGNTDWATIVVRDTGRGIPPERLHDIFEPFVQGESGYTREHGGTGLGLPISRNLARLMHGEVTVRSRTGQGSIFSLWLPQADRPDSNDGQTP